MATHKRIIYWIATIWLALGMVSTALVQLLKHETEVENIRNLGYPVSILALLGIWKILGVMAIMVPRVPLLKEWAYAGFFFAMSGAIWSRIVAGHSVGDIAPSCLLLVLTVISWYYRPLDRKLLAVSQ